MGGGYRRGREPLALSLFTASLKTKNLVDMGLFGVGCWWHLAGSKRKLGGFGPPGEGQEILGM